MGQKKNTVVELPIQIKIPMVEYIKRYNQFDTAHTIHTLANTHTHTPRQKHTKINSLVMYIVTAENNQQV